MTQYSLILDDHNEIKKMEFSTDNEELYNEVKHYIQNCVDAITYRNRIERINKQGGQK